MSSNRRSQSGTRFAQRGRLVVGIGLAAVCAAVAAGCGNSSSSSNSPGSTPAAQTGNTSSSQKGGPVKIGLLISLSGPASLFGVPTEDAAKLAISQINAKGGVLGHQLALAVGDDASVPSTGFAAAQKLVSGDGVNVLVGMHSSATRDAVQSLPGKAGILYLYTPVYEGGDCSSNVFAWGEVPNQQVTPTIPYMMSTYHGKRWYIIGDDYVWPHSLAADAAKTIAANGGTVVGQTFVPLGTSDFSSVVSKIKAANPDLIFAPLVGGDAVAFVKTAASFGLKAPYLTELMEEDTVAGIGAKADAGLNTALSYFQGLATPENQKYLAAYHAMFGASAPPQNSLSESVYEAINMWALAAEKAGSIDTSKVAAALPGISWDGPRGQVTMGSDHHVTQHMYLAAAQPDATLKVVHDFGEIAPATCGS